MEENDMKKTYKIEVDCANCANLMDILYDTPSTITDTSMSYFSAVLCGSECADSHQNSEQSISVSLCIFVTPFRVWV